MKLLLVLPILIPLLTAIAGLLVWRRQNWQRWLGVISSALLLAASLRLLQVVSQEGILTVQIGNWPVPYGITLVADLFSAIMIVLTGITGMAVAVFALTSLDQARETFGYHPLFQVLLMGVCGAFLTGDIFNLYVWFEVMLTASFVLLALGGERPQLEGAIKYVTLNLIASAIFLAAVGLLYGLTGTLNMADLARKLLDVEEPRHLTTLAMLFLVAFGIKSAAFPLFFWLPSSYHTPPPAVSAVFAGLLTKVGVYALIRVFTLIFVQEPEITHRLILVMAGLTMISGVLGAVAQNEFRRILSFHIVSQIGYMLMGLGLFTSLALAGSVFYIMHHIIVKSNLFLVSGVVERMRGTYQLKELGGLSQSSPLLSILFLIPALSLAGLPPLSGFFAKLILIQSGLALSSWAIVTVALIVGILTLFSMMKIWNEAFWKSPPEEERAASEHPVLPHDTDRTSIRVMLVPIIAMGALTVLIGIFAGPMFNLAERAAEQLLDPHGPGQYVETILGPEQ